MKLKDILAISGQPGLYQYIARSTNGIIVESLTDKKRMNTSGSAKISSMAEIAIYTDSDDVSISKVFENLYKHTGGAKAISQKSDAQLLKSLFAEILPDYDRERVHVSDMKKVITWFNALIDAGITDFSIEDPEEETQNNEEQKADN